MLSGGLSLLTLVSFIALSDREPATSSAPIIREMRGHASVVDPSAGLADSAAVEVSERADRDFHDWLAEYRQASSQSRGRMLDEGLSLARARRESLRALIQSDPEAALGQVLSLSEYQAVPEDLRPYVEQPFSGYADIDLQWATSVGVDGAFHCAHQNRLYFEGAEYDLYGPGRREAQQPVLDVPVVAYLLDDVALIDDSSVLPLSGADLLAADALFGHADQNGLDPLTGRSVDPEVAAVIGGKIYQFENDAMVEQVAHALEQAELSAMDARSVEVAMPYGWLAGDSGGVIPGTTQSSFFANDNINVLFIRCDFSDFPGEPVSQADLQDDLDSATGYETVSDVLNEMSYGVASVTATVTSTLYRPDSTGTSYAQAGDNDGLYTDVVAKYDAAPDALASSAYDVVAIYFPNLGGVTNSHITYGGLASVGGSHHWINGLSTSSSRLSVITHEFGHNYGLYHSNYWHPEHELGSYPNNYSDPSANSLEYGDIFDRMGSGSLPNGHFNPYQKHRIGWLPEDEIGEIASSGTYRVYRFDDINALDNPTLALRVPMGGGVYYWIGFRQLYTSNANLSSGAYVVAEGLYANRPNLIDMTPESEILESADRNDAGLPVGSSYYDADAGVRFTSMAVGTNGTGDEWIDVKVEFDSRVGFVANSYEYDEASGVATLTLQRLFGSSGAVSVDYATADLTATAGSDYYAASGTVTWADGDVSDKQIAISIRPDSAAEGIEDFTVTLSNVSSGVITSGADTATVSILDPGQRYASFTPDFFNTTVNAIGFQADGSAIIGGVINHSSGDFLDAGNIARLSADGSVDALFNDGGAGFDGTVRAILVQDDDKILVGGEFTTYNGTAANHLIRLNADGSIDSAFLTNIGAGADDTVYALATETDGEILVGGSFANFAGASTDSLGLVRLSADGTAGTALNLPFNTSFGASIRSILVEDDGKLTVTGSFYIDYTGTGFRSGIARLNADGTRDTSFDPDAGLHGLGATNSLRTGNVVARLPDGDYLVGGSFSAYDDNAADYFVRINADGSFDRVSPVAYANTVEAILVEPFGAAVTGRYNGGTAAPYLERIDEGWAADSGFTAGGGAGSSVFALAYAPDGALWVGGNFFSYNGSSSRPIVRLASGVSPYAFWAAEHFTSAQIAAGEAAPDTDFDGDGIANLGELALGTDPLVADASSIFGSGNLGGLELAQVSGSNYLQMTLDKSALSGGVWYCVQVSSDLTNWSPDPAVPGDESAFDILEDSPSRLVIRDKTPISAGSPRFARIVFKTPE